MPWNVLALLSPVPFKLQWTAGSISNRACILIDAFPGRTSDAVKVLPDIPKITTVDSCWEKPDIIIVVEVQNQDALTQLVLSRVHEIDGVAKADIHLVYRLQDTTAA